MKKVIGYIPGIWDMLHVGHLNILKRAKSVCDVLIVGVPTDEVVTEDKGRPPVIPMCQRCKMLAALKCVDVAIPYYELEFLTALRKYDVDVLIVGEDWGNQKRHSDAEAFVRRKGGRVVQFPYTKEYSSTKIKERVLEFYGARLEASKSQP